MDIPLQTVLKKDPRIEQENKRARGVLACAECRRLKLRCDKKIPCASCKRRGCASICPNGSLTTGQGTRFVLADTENLHHKISEMSHRIRMLEEALALLHSHFSHEVHDLLRPELLQVKVVDDILANPDVVSKPLKTSTINKSEFIEAFGTLAVSEDGGARFYGRSAGSESLLLDASHPQETASLPLPETVLSYSQAFPFSASDLPAHQMQNIVESFLPSWDRANELCYLYISQAPWFFGPITREQIFEDLLVAFYNDRSPSPPPTTGSSSSRSKSEPAERYGPHHLALLWTVFAVGALTDENLPPAPNNAEAESYYQLSRASFTLDPVLDRAPSVVTVQALSLMAIYQGMALKENSIESTWALMGISSKLAQSIGLHRDSAAWKLEPKEVQRRRAVFWELFVTDGWQSLATGRPASYTVPYLDCELPQDQGQTLDSDGNPVPSFPYWKARFGKECVALVVEATSSAHPPSYTTILEVDKAVRNLSLPRYSEQPLPTEGVTLSDAMSHFMPINYRGFVLVYLHRSFFAQALYDHPVDPMRSLYAPSFLAAYEAASSVVNALRKQYKLFPKSIARFWPLWTHAFSSTIIIGSVVTRATRSKVAPAAMAELNAARDLFESAAIQGGRAKLVLPVLRRLHDKAHSVFMSAYQNPSAAPTPLLQPEKEDEGDELAVFGGRKGLVVTKNLLIPAVPPSSCSPASGSSARLSAPPPSYASSSPGMQSSSSSSAAQSLSPLEQQHQQHTLPESFMGVHQGLLNEYHSFEGHLAAQTGSGAERMPFLHGWQNEQSTLYQNPPMATPTLIAPAGYPPYEYMPNMPPPEALGTSQSHVQQQQLHHHSSLQPFASQLSYDSSSAAPFFPSPIVRPSEPRPITPHTQGGFVQRDLQKTGNPQETWHSFLQDCEIPAPPTYRERRM